MAITKRFASEDYVIENIKANKTELEEQISLFDKKIDVLENKKIDSPDIANPGQMIVVKTVDDTGKPTEFEAVNIPKTEGGGITVETDPTVPSWAKQPTKPNYTKSDVGLSNVDNIKQYSAENEPPYPVTSVNGKAGSVQLTASDVGARSNTWMPSASDVGALPNTTKIPSSTSDLTNNSGFITKAVSDLANYYLKTDTYSKEELDNKISAIPKFAIEVVSSLPTSNISATTVYLVVTGDEENNIYTEYIYVSGRWEYLGKQTVDLTNYVKRTELSIYYSKTEIESLLEELRNFIPTRLSQLADDSSHRTVTDAEKESWSAKSTFSGSYTDLTNKPSIPSLSGYATENFVKGYAQPAGNYLTTIPSEYVTESELSGKGYLTEHQDLSDYAKRSELPTDYAKSVHEHDQYLTAIPSEYITESELNAKKYLTSVPEEYITESELSAKGYLTQHQSLDGYAKTSQIPTKTSQLTNDSDFATNESFNKIGGTVEITSGNPEKENTVLTVNPETIDEINLYSAEEIDNLIESVRNGSSSGEIPNLDGYATETYVKNYAQPKGSYLSSIPSEYVTETELNSKGYLTSIPDDIATHKDDTSVHVVYGVCETAGDVADKVVSVNGNFILKEGAIVIVSFINANSIAAPTLNVNGTGAKPMYRYGTTTMSTGTTTTGWTAGAIQMFVYDGTGWIRDYWNNTTYSNASLGHGYVTCSTAEATTAKTASLSSYALTTGGRVTVKFSNAVPANATLNINSKGAKAIYYRGAKIKDGIIKAGDIATFVYSSYYHLISIDRWQNDIDEISSELNAVKKEIVDQQEQLNEKASVTYVDDKIIDVKATQKQIGASFKDSMEELEATGDTSKLYVLPDGFIYAYMKTLVVGKGYTNQIPTSIDTDGSIYNGKGFKDDVRLSSSGGISGETQTGSTTTGFVPFKSGCTVRIKGAIFFDAPSGHYYFNFYGADKKFIFCMNVDYFESNIGSFTNYHYDETTGITTINFLEGVNSEYGRYADSSAFIRITAYGKGENLIVTVNEEIKEATTTESYAWANTGRAFVPADYEDRIVELEKEKDDLLLEVEELKQQMNDVIDGTTEVATSSKFDPTSYRLPILYLDGDTSGMTKDVKKTLNYSYGELSGTCTCKWQGATSTYWDKKNYTIVFDNPFEAKEGWGSQKKYCFKANWIDHSHSRNIVSCKLWGMSVKSRATVPTELANLPNGGAIDGFPCIIMLNGEFHGLYTWNIPKDGWMFGLVEDTTKQQAIVGANQHSTATQFKGEVAGDESDFELEFVSDENNKAWVNTSLNRLINACISSNGTDLDTTVAQYLDWASAIDYYIQVVVEDGTDAVDKNFLLVTFDGVKWYFSNYDRDTTYGLAWDASSLSRPVSGVKFTTCATTNRVFELIKNFKKDELKARYTELRSNVLSESRICQQFENFAWDISSPILLEDVKKWTSIRGSSVNGIDQICRWVRQRLEVCDKWIDEL